MPIDTEKYQEIIAELGANVQLIAVSKIKPVEDIQEMYAIGQRDFGENYVQELVDKQLKLPTDIRWHFIGHLQSNKIKFIAPFIHLIQGVDSLKLLKEISKQAVKHSRQINCLLQVHIAEEETKFGFDEHELEALIGINLNQLDELKNIHVCGLMGMASFSDDVNKVRSEYRKLKLIFDNYSQQQTKNFKLETLSMGMSGDYKIAIEEGSNMVRIGSLLFGKRLYPNKAIP